VGGGLIFGVRCDYNSPKSRRVGAVRDFYELFAEVCGA